MAEIIDFEGLLDRFYSSNSTPAERETLFALLREPENDVRLKRWLEQHSLPAHPDLDISEDAAESMLQAVFRAAPAMVPELKQRKSFVSVGWFRYAAILLLIAGASAYFFVASRSSEQTIPIPIAADSQLRENRAVLTLSDGRTIALDSATNGIVARQGSTQIEKLANGQIVYHPAAAASETLINAISTARGGQYQLVLPDGTRVWLNAASSITYPAAFADKERRVTVTGEAYFEVAADMQKPFKVNVDGKSWIEVLGTSFNVNSYPDEENIKATLIEGLVKVGSTKHVILKPGQQAIVHSADPHSQQMEAITVSDHANLEQALAWKNGLFNFDGVDFKTMMRQLERWYDIKVQYQGASSNITFRGQMYRSANLSVVLEALQKMTGLRFRLEGKTLIIL